MWYGGQGRDGHDRIHLAESDDGVNWVRRGVVLDNGEANHVNDPSVVKVGNVTCATMFDPRCTAVRFSPRPGTFRRGGSGSPI